MISTWTLDSSFLIWDRHMPALIKSSDDSSAVSLHPVWYCARQHFCSVIVQIRADLGALAPAPTCSSWIPVWLPVLAQRPQDQTHHYNPSPNLSDLVLGKCRVAQAAETWQQPTQLITQLSLVGTWSWNHHAAPCMIMEFLMHYSCIGNQILPGSAVADGHPVPSQSWQCLISLSPSTYKAAQLHITSAPVSRAVNVGHQGCWDVIQQCRQSSRRRRRSRSMATVVENKQSKSRWEYSTGFFMY